MENGDLFPRPLTHRAGSLLVRLCQRCRVRYSPELLCGHCLRSAQRDIGEKRSILLPEGGGADALTAVA